MRGPLIALLGLLVAATLQGAVCDQPSEYECRPYIEKALKDSLGSLPASSPEDAGSNESDADELEMMQDDPGASVEEGTETASVEETGEVAEVSGEPGEVTDGGDSVSTEGAASAEGETSSGEGQLTAETEGATGEPGDGSSGEQSTEGEEASLESAAEAVESIEDGTSQSGDSSEETAEAAVSGGESLEGTPEGGESLEDGNTEESESIEDGITEGGESLEEGTIGGAESLESIEDGTHEGGESLENEAVEGGASLKSVEDGAPEGDKSLEKETAEVGESVESIEDGTPEGGESLEKETTEGGDSVESVEDGTTEGGESQEKEAAEGGDSIESVEDGALEGGESLEKETAEGGESLEEGAVEGGEASSEEETTGAHSSEAGTSTGDASTESLEEGQASTESTEGGEASVEEFVAQGAQSIEGSISEEKSAEGGSSEEAAGKEESDASVEGEVVSRKPRSVEEGAGSDASEGDDASTEVEPSTEDVVSDAEEAEPEPAVVEETPEEELSYEVEIPENLRPRDHIAQILRLDEESLEDDVLVGKAIETTLKELKRFYDNAIKPLEIVYKYRDLSNRHFGDPEIFSKPLILFMGPWSGGKSSIINYLLDNEYKRSSLRTGAEPSPAYFNILMWGDREEVLDGTQLAADWTFSGLQKFGQGLLDRLRGLRLNNRLLEKVNIVEIPGILEIRKQVERVFPFNDACQWFIDRADIIFLVYDPAKLDVGPETEAILDQLKGREYQTRIVLNKADQVRPEELMRVQGTLIWNISPLMSSTQPPVMYSTSLWSMPYELGAPLRLLRAQERAFLRDMREAIDKRVENKIASARRFAVRVRNHAKMVDCYLTTYYNHKSFFGNRKHISDDIIEKPQDYHIYEGLSTLTNISRYDLPDPETYRDFFRVNPLYEFQQLAATCTYFKGCPINRLDVAIAYELPELVGKYKKAIETALTKSPPT